MDFEHMNDAERLIAEQAVLAFREVRQAVAWRRNMAAGWRSPNRRP